MGRDPMPQGTLLLRLVEWLHRVESLAVRPLGGFGIPVSVAQLIVAVGVLLASHALSRLVASLLGRLVQRAFGEAETLTSGLRRTVVAVGTMLGAMAALRVVGVDPAEFLDTHVFTLRGQSVSLMSVMLAVAIVVAAWLASRVLQLWFARHAQVSEGQSGAHLAAVSKLGHYLIMLVGLALALENLGVNLVALFAVGGVVMIALGFAMQTIAQNFISGVILLVERAIKPGDILEVEGRVVRVEELGIRTTVARTLDGEDLIIPNATIVQGTVTNFTHRDSNYRLRVKVGVAYSSDMRQVFDALRGAVAGLEWALTEPGSRVLMTGFGNNSVDFEISVWMNDPWTSRPRRSELHQAIWWALQEAGIVIAFPQLDLHVDPPVLEALAAGR